MPGTPPQPGPQSAVSIDREDQARTVTAPQEATLRDAKAMQETQRKSEVEQLAKEPAHDSAPPCEADPSQQHVDPALAADNAMQDIALGTPPAGGQSAPFGDPTFGTSANAPDEQSLVRRPAGGLLEQSDSDLVSASDFEGDTAEARAILNGTVQEVASAVNVSRVEKAKA